MSGNPSPNNGTLYGDASYTTEGLTEDILDTGALHLDGNGDYVRIPDSPSLRPGQFTIAAWAKLSEVSDPSNCDSLIRKDWGTRGTLGQL